MLLRGDLTTEQLPLADGPPLGAEPRTRLQTTVPFHVGDTVLAFSDGLIERRDEDISQGQQRVVHEMPTLALAELVAAVEGVVHRVRDPARDDDVAALAARRTT